MRRFNTEALVLRRTDYGEADRIINVYTATHGRLSAIARGVRKPKSKLAGGIELFSVCELGLIQGKSDLHTVTSSRMGQHFGDIITDYDVMQHGYAVLRYIDKFTVDAEPSQELFDMAVSTLTLLNTKPDIADVTLCWSLLQLMKQHGSLPNLTAEIDGSELAQEGTYSFSVEDGGFFNAQTGMFTGTDIKAWRVFTQASAKQIAGISGLMESAAKSKDTLRQFVEFQA